MLGETIFPDSNNTPDMGLTAENLFWDSLDVKAAL